jgi:hypothetical protein
MISTLAYVRSSLRVVFCTYCCIKANILSSNQRQDSGNSSKCVCREISFIDYSIDKKKRLRRGRQGLEVESLEQRVTEAEVQPSDEEATDDSRGQEVRRPQVLLLVSILRARSVRQVYITNQRSIEARVPS